MPEYDATPVTVTMEWFGEALKRENQALHAKVIDAVKVAEMYGGSWATAQRLLWVIDQMVRRLMGEEAYAAWVKEYNENLENSEEDGWSEGVAP